MSVFRCCEIKDCKLNHKLCFRELPYYLMFGKDHLCLTILCSYGLTELEQIIKWLNNNKQKNLILRLVYEKHIDEIIERNRNKTYLEYDNEDDNRERALCFYTKYIGLKILLDTLQSINSNVQIEIHKDSSTLTEHIGYSDFYFSFDNTDDFYNGYQFCKKIYFMEWNLV